MYLLEVDGNFWSEVILFWGQRLPENVWETVTYKRNTTCSRRVACRVCTEQRTEIPKIIKIQNFQMMFFNITSVIGNPALPTGCIWLQSYFDRPNDSSNKVLSYHVTESNLPSDKWYWTCPWSENVFFCQIGQIFAGSKPCLYCAVKLSQFGIQQSD